jgi:solute carrier family 25 carnitine/acylcarnitine transporter 20/29
MMSYHIINLHSSIKNFNFTTISKSECNCPYKNLGKNLSNNSYIYGCISGMTGIILSHPIDSIKTHRQTLNNIPFKYSFRNLYKGILSPLIGVGIEKALVFGTYANCKDHFNLNTPLSGAIAGLIASLIVSPYERIKILTQTSQPITFKPSFLFKGLGTTFTREVPGFAIYFTMYEFLKKSYISYTSTDISLTASFIFGGISGSMAWLFIYPQDRIKTLIQSQSTKSSILDIVKSIYANGGLTQFYKGFSLALGRAILLHSGTFCMMEYLKKNKN